MTHDEVIPILDRVALPYPDLEAHLDDLLVLRDGGDVVGCVAMELYDEAGLLRSLAMVCSTATTVGFPYRE